MRTSNGASQSHGRRQFPQDPPDDPSRDRGGNRDTQPRGHQSESAAGSITSNRAMPPAPLRTDHLKTTTSWRNRRPAPLGHTNAQRLTPTVSRERLRHHRCHACAAPAFVIGHASRSPGRAPRFARTAGQPPPSNPTGAELLPGRLYSWRRASPRLAPTKDPFCSGRATHVPRRSPATRTAPSRLANGSSCTSPIFRTTKVLVLPAFVLARVA